MSEIIPVSNLSSAPLKESSSETALRFEEFLSGASSSIGGIAIDGLSTIGGLSMSGDLFGLIELQRQLQIEMETVSMISNIDKSRHESRMAAIRNIRTN